ncbi:MAG: T9SS type A sorting domain-containing protein [Bacteroidetes bacterium]|nr:T9SS type A sorting domain-containing protein [Bacteroidota bacterium]
MKELQILKLLFFAFFLSATNLLAQRGYYDAPYVHYEADSAVLANASITAKSYDQKILQSEASNQVCVDLSLPSASVEFTIVSAGDGLVLRYSVPDGEWGSVDLYADGIFVDTLHLGSHYSWENLGLPNTNPKMRFDEVHFVFPTPIAATKKLKLVRRSGNIHIDFVELELIPAALTPAQGDAVYMGDGSDLQTFIDNNGGKNIFLPAKKYLVNSELYFGVSNTVLKGAGMWYTEIFFSDAANGGLLSNADKVSFSNLYLNTINNFRTNSYKGINGVFVKATITNVWAEHFDVGIWVAQYNTGGPASSDSLVISSCRFRNNYADGVNFCKGTKNSVVEHCSFRNNGDDDMAIWSANGMECINNTFRYNTAENGWRSSGCALYGGQNNHAHHLLIKDHQEAGIKVNNDFQGVAFNQNGLHTFSDITLIACGTFNTLYNGNNGAIDISCNTQAGTRINNVQFSNIDIIDAKNDGIYMYIKGGGEGFFNVNFENIAINGTGKEYPNNNNKNLDWGRGYGFLFVGNPAGFGTYCNITYSNRGGNALSNINNAQIGTFDFIQDCSAPSATFITSPVDFGICASVVLEATTTAPLNATVLSMEFFVDENSVGSDMSSPFSTVWSKPVVGSHKLKAVAHYSDNSFSTSLPQYFSVEEGVFTTATAPVVDGVIDAAWNAFAPNDLNKISVGSFNDANDLSAYFKVSRDATNLYLLVDVTDDILRNDGAANWQKDAVEIFIDMGNDKSGAYVANNDFQYTFVYNISTAKPGLTFVQTTKVGDLGYILEIVIPWSTLGGAPADGTFMGIDVQVDDNDSGNRNGKKAWQDITDQAWQSTAVLGTLEMASCANTYDPNAVVQLNNNLNFSLYPNPLSETGNLNLVSNGGELFSVSIVDLNGKVLYNANLSGGETFSFGADLAPGMYLLKVSNDSSVACTKFIKN